MNDLNALLSQAVEPFRLLPAPDFNELRRLASRRHRRRRVGLAATASVLCVGSGAGVYLVHSAAAPPAQLGASSGTFVRQGATTATVCVAAEPKVCTEWGRPTVARFLDAVLASPPMPVEKTWPCQSPPEPYRNADVTLRYSDGSSEVLNINTGCGFIRNNRSELYESATPAVSALVFGEASDTSSTVTGDAQVVGGPAPGASGPIPGDIAIYRGSHATGTPVAMTVADVQGNFQVSLPPGLYTFASTAGQARYGVACSTTTVTAGTSRRFVAIRCQVP